MGVFTNVCNLEKNGIVSFHWVYFYLTSSLMKTHQVLHVLFVLCNDEPFPHRPNIISVRDFTFYLYRNYKQNFKLLWYWSPVRTTLEPSRQILGFVWSFLFTVASPVRTGWEMSSSPTAFPLYADLVLGLTLQPAHSNLCNCIQYGKSMFVSKDLGGTRSLDPNRRGSTFAFCCVFQSQAGMREAGQWKDGDAATLCHGEIFFTRHHTVLHSVHLQNGLLFFTDLYS